jgi:prepilin-type N-terminal cleavage/methylation domain-containing protein
MRQPRQPGMTLIELLIAVAIGMAMIALTWTSFVHTKSTVARTTARVDLHASAAQLEDALRRDLANLAPALASFARSATASTGADTRTETVELVFMRTTSPLDKLNAVPGEFDNYLADHHWVRWRFTRSLQLVSGVWQVRSGALYRSSSTPARAWKTTAALSVLPSVIDPSNAAPKANYQGVQWINLPRPLRDGKTWGIDGLRHNTYGVPAAAVDATTPIGDIDDLADLDANERLASSQVRSFTIGWSDAGGQAFTVACGVAADERRNGLYLDVVGPENGTYPGAAVVPPVSSMLDSSIVPYDYKPDLAARPRLIRFALGMRDDASAVAQDFAFSVAVAGPAPAVIRPSP